jgi:hypothetical protein
LVPEKTEEYYLPPFSQEQGSTRGNMIVLNHYWLVVLLVAKSVFDRVSTFDHLACFECSSGLMHVCMNMCQNFGRNFWGGKNRDAVSLLTLQDKHPNRTNINPAKIDFYGWLHFLDTVLRSLIIKGVMTILEIKMLKSLNSHGMMHNEFKTLCEEVVDVFLMPSIDRLEADGVKSLQGRTESGHAVVLAHDLMTMQDMRDSIKWGHPMRVKRMLKYWTPMFYAGGGYNYSNELMELLHNVEHDWPCQAAQTIFNGMLVNSMSKPGGWTETDICVE